MAVEIMKIEATCKQCTQHAYQCGGTKLIFMMEIGFAGTLTFEVATHQMRGKCIYCLPIHVNFSWRVKGNILCDIMSYKLFFFVQSILVLQQSHVFT